MAKPIILIIEQNPATLQGLVSAFVRTACYTVYSSRSHEGALLLLSNYRGTIQPNVIITYYGGLARDLRRFIQNVRRGSPNTKIIIFSENPMISNDYPVAEIINQSEPEGIDILLHRVGPLIYQSAQASKSAKQRAAPPTA